MHAHDYVDFLLWNTLLKKCVREVNFCGIWNKTYYAEGTCSICDDFIIKSTKYICNILIIG